MAQQEDQLEFFTPVSVYKSATIRFSCFCLPTSTMLIAGTKTGGIIGYQLNQSFAPASIFIEHTQLFKTPISQIAFLEDCYNLLVFTDGNLHYYNVNKKRSKELLRGITWFDIQRVGLKAYLFVASKNKIIRADLTEFFDSARDKKDLQSFKEFPFEKPIKNAAMVGETVAVELISHEILILNVETQKVKNSNLPQSGETMIGSLDTGEILALFRFDMKKFTSIFFDKEGSLAKNRSSLTIFTGLQISKVVSSRNFLGIVTGSGVHVFTMKDCRLVQVLVLPDQQPDCQFNFLGDSLYAVSETVIYMFRKPKIDRLFELTMQQVNYKAGVSLLRVLSEDNPAYAQDFINKLYSHCGWQLLSVNKHAEATECFLNIPFDPVELLQENMPGYIVSRASFKESYPEQLKNFMCKAIKRRREDLVKRLDRAVIRPVEMVRKNRSDEDGRVEEWLQIIDYAYIRLCIELRTFQTLFEFLRTTPKVYCDNKNSSITELFKLFQNSVQINATELAVKAELNIMIRNFSAAMANLAELYPTPVDVNKFNFKVYAKNRAMDVLLSIQTDASFSTLLSQHFDWLTKEMEGVLQFFQKLNPTEKTTAKVIECLGRISDSNDNKFVIKNAFLSNLIASENSPSDWINSEHFLTIMEVFKRNFQLATLKQAFDFLTAEGRSFNLELLRVNYDRLVNECQAREPKIMDRFGELFSMQMIIMRRINKSEVHEEAIKLMIKKKEFSQVEDYCAGTGMYATNSIPKIGNKAEEQSPGGAFNGKTSIEAQSKNDSLLNLLLNTYLEQMKLKEIPEINWKMINGLLIKFAGNPNLNAVDVVNQMPENVLKENSKIDIFKFVEATLTEFNAQEKELKFQQHISEALLNKLESDLWKCRKRWVKIEDDSYCSKCGVRLLNRVFDVYPNGVVTDHNCFSESPERDPLTRQNFSKTTLI